MVDLRVLQANERTLLAWIRTGVALMAFGFVVARFAFWIRLLRGEAAHAPGGSSWFGVALVALGALTSAAAAVQYLRVRRAILEERAIAPGGVLAPGVAVAVAAGGLALALHLALF